MGQGAEIRLIEPRISHAVRCPHCGRTRPFRKEREYWRTVKAPDLRRPVLWRVRMVYAKCRNRACPHESSALPIRGIERYRRATAQPIREGVVGRVADNRSLTRTTRRFVRSFDTTGSKSALDRWKHRVPCQYDFSTILRRLGFSDALCLDEYLRRKSHEEFLASEQQPRRKCHEAAAKYFWYMIGLLVLGMAMAWLMPGCGPIFREIVAALPDEQRAAVEAAVAMNGAHSFEELDAATTSDAVLVSSYLSTDGTGKARFVDKRAYWQALSAKRSGDLAVRNTEIRDLRVEILGDTAEITWVLDVIRKGVKSQLRCKNVQA